MDPQNDQPDSREQFLDQSDTKPASQKGSEIRIAGLLKALLDEMEGAKVIDTQTNKELYQRIGSALKVFYKKDDEQAPQQNAPQQQQQSQPQQPQQTATEAFHEARRLKLKRAYHFNL